MPNKDDHGRAKFYSFNHVLQFHVVLIVTITYLITFRRARTWQAIWHFYSTWKGAHDLWKIRRLAFENAFFLSKKMWKLITFLVAIWEAF